MLIFRIKALCLIAPQCYTSAPTSLSDDADDDEAEAVTASAAVLNDGMRSGGSPTAEPSKVLSTETGDPDASGSSRA